MLVNCIHNLLLQWNARGKRERLCELMFEKYQVRLPNVTVFVKCDTVGHSMRL